MAPFKIFLGASVTVTFFLNFFAEDYMPSRSLILTAVDIFAVEIAGWLIWRCLLYPNLFSPLRTMPGPSVCPLRFLFLSDLPSLSVNRVVHS